MRSSRTTSGRSTGFASRRSGARAPSRPLDANVVSLPRALSKLGYCSRTEAAVLVEAGRVRVNGRVAKLVTLRVHLVEDAITVDGAAVVAAQKYYLMLNKPRGLITTRNDPQQRGTVYDCLAGHEMPYLSAVGRLDKASEGLLLMTNDTLWAERLLNPVSHVDKRYHVKIDRQADAVFLAAMADGIDDDGERLTAKSVSLLREGPRSSWLDIVLDQGRNRQIRRMVAALGADVMRLVRIEIGSISLGDLPKGEVRALSLDEVQRLSGASAR